MDKVFNEKVIALWDQGLDFAGIADAIHGKKSKHDCVTTVQIADILYENKIIPVNIKSGPYAEVLNFIRESRRNGGINKTICKYIGVKPGAISYFLGGFGLVKVSIEDSKWDEVIKDEHIKDEKRMERRRKAEIERIEEVKRARRNAIKKRSADRKRRTDPVELAEWKDGVTYHISLEKRNIGTPSTYHSEGHMEKMVGTLISALKTYKLCEDYDVAMIEKNYFKKCVKDLGGIAPSEEDALTVFKMFEEMMQVYNLKEQFMRNIFIGINTKIDEAACAALDKLIETVQRSNEIIDWPWEEMYNIMYCGDPRGATYYEKTCRAISGPRGYRCYGDVKVPALIWVHLYWHLKENWEKPIFKNEGAGYYSKNKIYNSMDANISYYDILWASQFRTGRD